MSSLSPKEIFVGKPYPAWFVKHPIFREIKTIKKVFPGIGLPNTQSETTDDNIDTSDDTVQLVNDIADVLDARQQRLVVYAQSHPKMAAGRKEQADRCSTLFGKIVNLIDNKPKEFISIQSGKKAIKLSSDICLPNEKKPIFRKNESLFRVYNKCSELLAEGKFTKLKRLETIPSFKDFSAANIPSGKFKIVFSSDGKEGAWDIGTMSMRGIRSCQSWNDGEYSHCTIGSVIDPFVGIIYLTSGAKYNEYGSKMIRRCIVRFVINSKTNSPYLLLDNMYPNLDDDVLRQFKKFLKDKTDGKFEVHYANNMSSDLVQHTYIPLTDIRKRLRQLDSEGGKLQRYYDGERNSIESYQDAHIESKEGGKKDEQNVLFEKNSRKKETKFIKDFQESFSKAIKDIDVAAFSDAVKPVIRRLKGVEKNFNYGYIANEVAKMIAIEIIANVDKKQFVNSDTYIRRVHYAWFNVRGKVLDMMKAKIVREINSKLQFKNKLRTQHLPKMMSGIIPAIDEMMKPHLKEIVAKRKFSGVLPLP